MPEDKTASGAKQESLMINPPHKSFSSRLDWAFDQGSKILWERYTTADSIKKEAASTLSFLMTAAGITFAYSFSKVNDQISGTIVISSLLCIYYTIFALLLIWKTNFIKAYPSPYQEPKNLITNPHVDMDVYVKKEIENIQSRLARTDLWIRQIKTFVNIAKLAFVLSPVFGIIALIIYRHLG